MAQSKQAPLTVYYNYHPTKTETAVSLEDVYKGICNLVSEVKEIIARDIEVDSRSKINQFFACQPPSFGNDTDPSLAKAWIWRLELLFSALNCSEEQKVPFAVLKLDDPAMMWWIGVERGFETDGVSVTWEKFKELFLDRYFPQWLQQEKHVELLNLVQGDRSVVEYDTEFMKLCALASSISLVDGESKAMLFERGLRPEIRRRMINRLDAKTYYNVREMALIVEHSYNDY